MFGRSVTNVGQFGNIWAGNGAQELFAFGVSIVPYDLMPISPIGK